METPPVHIDAEPDQVWSEPVLSQARNLTAAVASVIVYALGAPIAALIGLPFSYFGDLVGLAVAAIAVLTLGAWMLSRLRLGLAGSLVLRREEVIVGAWWSFRLAYHRISTIRLTPTFQTPGAEAPPALTIQAGLFKKVLNLGAQSEEAAAALRARCPAARFVGLDGVAVPPSRRWTADSLAAARADHRRVGRRSAALAGLCLLAAFAPSGVPPLGFVVPTVALVAHALSELRRASTVGA